MGHEHVALEHARCDADERHVVAVLRIHVCLNLEHKAGERLVRRVHHPAAAITRDGRRSEREKAVEQHLHTEVIHRAAEENGRQFSRADILDIETRAGAVEQFQVFADFRIHVVGQRVFHRVIFNAPHVNRRAIHAAGDALKQMHLLLLTVEDALKILPVAQRPVQRKRRDAEHPLQLIHQVQRRTRGPVQLVHESEDRHASPAADFKELQRLRLDALARIDHHHRRIHRREHAVRVLREILVPRRVEQVHHAIPVFKLQHRRRHRDPALLLQLHPVTRRGPLVLARRHAPRELHRAAVEQELLGQRRLTRIGMRDDGKSAATRDFTRVLGCAGLARRFNSHGAPISALPVRRMQAARTTFRIRTARNPGHALAKVGPLCLKSAPMQTDPPPPRRKWHLKRWFTVLIIAVFAWSGWRVYDKRNAIKEARGLGWHLEYTDPVEAIQVRWVRAFRKDTWTDGVEFVLVPSNEAKEHLAIIERLNPRGLGIIDATTLGDLSALGSLTRLRRIWLRGCAGLTNVSALKNLSTLGLIDLTGCTGLTRESVEALKAALPNATIIEP